MNKTMKHGALALGLIAGALLVTAPAATAKSIQRDGYFGGTWSPIGPKNNRHVKRYHRNYGGYYGPRRYSYYGPRAYYGDPYYYDYGPGVGFSFRIR